MSFFVRRLQPGDVFQTRLEEEEAAFVILGGLALPIGGTVRSRLENAKMYLTAFPTPFTFPHSATFPSPQKRRAKLRSAVFPRKLASSPDSSPQRMLSAVYGAAGTRPGRLWMC